MAYSTLLFDIDDTILDFQSSEKQALKKLFNHLHQPLTTTMANYYQQLNVTLWQRYERGEIARADLLNQRFTLFFHHFGEDVDGIATERIYRQYLAEGHQPMPGAPSLLADLSRDYELYIITNGIAQTQIRRIREAGFAPYFRQLFISEQIGAQKPSQAFFKSVAHQIDHFKKADTLVIGDSLTSDILGAANYGLDSVWFNPHHLVNQTPTTPTYEIDRLNQLKIICS